MKSVQYKKKYMLCAYCQPSERDLKFEKEKPQGERQQEKNGSYSLFFFKKFSLMESY